MQLKQDLEKGDTKVKIEALKKTIYMILNGEKIQGLLMNIIRFVLPSQDHTIKKMLLIFWEIIPKTYPDGKLMQEMILVCDAYRKDLQHPNEFIRGSTLRFLCKLKEPELLEPLMPTIRACLEHRHSYVRRNAVMAIFTIYKNFDFLIPDAPELIANFLDGVDQHHERIPFAAHVLLPVQEVGNQLRGIGDEKVKVLVDGEDCHDSITPDIGVPVLQASSDGWHQRLQKLRLLELAQEAQG